MHWTLYWIFLHRKILYVFAGTGSLSSPSAASSSRSPPPSTPPLNWSRWVRQTDECSIGKALLTRVLWDAVTAIKRFQENLRERHWQINIYNKLYSIKPDIKPFKPTPCGRQRERRNARKTTSWSHAVGTHKHLLCSQPPPNLCSLQLRLIHLTSPQCPSKLKSYWTKPFQ